MKLSRLCVIKIKSIYLSVLYIIVYTCDAINICYDRYVSIRMEFLINKFITHIQSSLTRWLERRLSFGGEMDHGDCITLPG